MEKQWKGKTKMLVKKAVRKSYGGSILIILQAFFCIACKLYCMRSNKLPS